jgi:hypothetical protein
MHPRQLWLGLTLLGLVACAHPAVTVAPAPLQDIAPIHAQVDPHLSTLTERWAAVRTSGEARVGTLLHQMLVDDPRAPLLLTYVTSRLDVATVVSPVFYRPHAYQARYQLTVRVESPAISTSQAWLQATGEGRSWASAARAASDAVTQTVRALGHQLATLRDTRALQGASDRSPR